MRTTIRLNERLLAEAKRYATETGRTFTALVEDALHETLARQHRRAPARPIKLKTVGGSGPQPGVDLDDNADLLELTERGP